MQTRKPRLDPHAEFAAVVKTYTARMQKDLSIKGFQADGIWGNIGHESNGTTAIQEVHPVAGRGGAGWLQWTGARRVQFEAWLKANHYMLPSGQYDYANHEANYLYFIHETLASFRSVVNAIRKTRTRDSACDIFEQMDERAGAPALASRHSWSALAEAARIQVENQLHPSDVHVTIPSEQGKTDTGGGTSWWDRLFGHGNKWGSGNTPSADVPSTRVPGTAEQPPIPPPTHTSAWTLLKRLIGRPTAPPTSPLPAELTKGDPTVYRVQEALLKRGYTEVGWVDGEMGDRTRAAIRSARGENNLPDGDEIDAKFLAALPHMPARSRDPKRADATAATLRQEGQPAVHNFDLIGLGMKVLFGGSLLGGADQAGLMEKIKDTVGTAQDTVQQANDIVGQSKETIVQIVNGLQWCFHHWWIFAIALSLFVLLNVARGLLDIVVKFRQGVLTHPGA